MRYITVAVCLLVVIIVVKPAVTSSVQSIHCHDCVGVNCFHPINCSLSYDACSYRYSKVDGNETRQCTQQGICTALANSCKTSQLCEMKCCQSNLCNAPPLAPSVGSSLLTSGLRVWIATLVMLTASLMREYV